MLLFFFLLFLKYCEDLCISHFGDRILLHLSDKLQLGPYCFINTGLL